LTLTRTPQTTRLLAALAVALALAVAALGLGASDAQARRGMEIAASDDLVLVKGSRFLSRERALRAARGFGVTRIRINVGWALTLTPQQRKARRKPANLRYQFGLIDSAIDAAARFGMRTHLSLTFPAPAWATSNRRVGVVRPNPTAFAEFVRIAARHFRGRIDRYSVGNESNIRPWLQPFRSSARLYRTLYRRAYAAIKAQDRRAAVLFGATSPYGRRGFAHKPIAWLRGVLCVNRRWKRRRSCPRFKADGYDHHPYDFLHAANFRYPGRDNATMGTLRNLTRALDRFSRSGALRRNGGGRMPLFLTEYGYFARGHRALSRRKRTRYLFQGWTIALRNSRVRSNLQYLIASPTRRSSSAYFDLALLTTRGRRYPQYNTLVRWFRRYRRLVKRPGGPIRLPPAPAS
jgi:hypothetical protein